MDKGVTYIWDCGEEVCNYCGTSERHLSSRKDVSDEGSYYYKEQEDYAYVPGLFKYVGPVIETSADVEVNADKEEGGSVGVHVSDESAKIYISADMSYG